MSRFKGKKTDKVIIVNKSDKDLYIYLLIKSIHYGFILFFV